RLTALARMQVVLDAVQAELECPAQAHQRVLGRLARCPAVPEDPGRAGNPLPVLAKLPFGLAHGRGGWTPLRPGSMSSSASLPTEQSRRMQPEPNTPPPDTS